MTKNKLTKEQKEFVKLVKGLIGLKRNYYTIDKILESNGFHEVRSGGYKTVYKRKGDEYCVKVWYNSWGWREDSFKVPRLLKGHYIHPIHKNKRYLIQQWIERPCSVHGYNGPVRKLPSEVRESVYDIRDDNIRVHGDREVVIDFCYAHRD